jgi:hypothetical protein
MPSATPRPTARPLYLLARILTLVLMLTLMGILVAIFSAPRKLLRNVDFEFNEFIWAASHPIWELITVSIQSAPKRNNLRVNLRRSFFQLCSIP